MRNNFCRKCAGVDLSGSRYTGVDEEVGDTVENLTSKHKAGPSALIPTTSKGVDSSLIHPKIEAHILQKLDMLFQYIQFNIYTQTATFYITYKN